MTYARSKGAVWSALAGAALGAALVPAAHAQAAGFQLNRYEPTPVGEWSLAVPHPWFSSTRLLAAGLTLNYAHDPLVFGQRAGAGFTQQQEVIAHQLLGHLELAGSIWDRVTLSVMLPVTLAESGQAVGGIGPVSGTVVGDPRFGLMVRLWRMSQRGPRSAAVIDADPVSLSLGVDTWLPVGAADRHAGDGDVRVLPKLVLSGLSRSVRWSFVGGYYYRQDATLAPASPAVSSVGSTIGPALQLGAAAAYADAVHGFSVGPELLLHTTLTGGHAFQRDYTNLEILLGGHYSIARQVQVGLGVGIGTLRDPGTPDARVVLRLAWAPLPAPAPAREPDRDGDGVPDGLDACPAVPGVPTADPATSGCPPVPDRDRDGVPDQQDLCPDEPLGQRPDPALRGCPLRDADGDGVMDPDDLCATVAAGPHPDPARPGCPLPEPARDSAPDQDGACPDGPGPSCPGLVALRGGMLVILSPVFFATDQDVILERSEPVLQALADALQAKGAIRRLAVEGHTDNTGVLAHNMDLSERRAQSVRRWLIEHGVAEERLEAHGYGPTRPVRGNETDAGRQANRRVEFRILDPTQGE